MNWRRNTAVLPQLVILSSQITLMKINLLSCDAKRPDKRAIAKCLGEIAGLDASLANELTDMFLQGDVVDIEVEDKTSGSALRALRKLSIDYEIIE